MQSSRQKRKNLDNKRVKKRIKEIQSKPSADRTADENAFLSAHQ